MTRWGRVARGAVAASLSVFFAAFAHSIAGGTLPGIAGIALCLIFSVIVCSAFAGRRMPRTRLAASILASQAMYHWLFGSLGTLEATTAPAAGTLGHVHNAPVDLSTLSTVAHDHGDMLFAHLAAAALTFGVLAFGERSIAAAVRAARALVVSLLPALAEAPLVPAPCRLFARGIQIATPRECRIYHSGLRHRGPPSARLA